MINIEINRNYIGNVYRFKVEGHAESVPDGNEDPVCAVVSTATQFAVLGLIDVLDIKVNLTIGSGILDCELPEITDSEILEKANVLLETLTLTLRQIAEQYADYVKLSEMEE